MVLKPWEIPSLRTALPGQCGAYLEAVYRPLPTVYTESGQIPLTWANPQNAFDYVDPQMYPASGAVPTNHSLYVLPDASALSWGIAVDGNPQLTDTWQEFTIRRVMCPTVPWNTIRQLTNRINQSRAWTPANMTIPGLPGNTFSIGTLRFDSAEPIKRVMPYCFDSSGNVLIGATGDIPITQQVSWWDILYKFSWRTKYAPWRAYDGTLQPITQLSWNHTWFDGIGFLGTAASPALGMRYPGWYDAGFWMQDPTLQVKFYPKYLDAEDETLPINDVANRGTPTGLPFGTAHPFDALFMLAAT